VNRKPSPLWNLTISGPHTFSNPFDEEAKFINTYTPAFYINYFKLLAKMNEEGKPMNPESNKKAMVPFTVPPIRLTLIVCRQTSPL